MKRVDQIINGGTAVFFGNAGQMGVPGSCLRLGVPQKGLNMPEAQAAFKQVCGETVAQRVNTDFFLMPHSATATLMACWVPPLFI
jgi:hypothetical protein